MDDAVITKGYRNAWRLVLVAALFVVGFALFTLRANTPAKTPAWDMGGARFVPASSLHGDGYYVAPAAPGVAP